MINLGLVNGYTVRIINTGLLQVEHAVMSIGTVQEVSVIVACIIACAVHRDIAW